MSEKQKLILWHAFVLDPPRFFNANSGEASHKDTVKGPYKQTNRQAKSSTKQVTVVVARRQGFRAASLALQLAPRRIRRPYATSAGRAASTAVNVLCVVKVHVTVSAMATGHERDGRVLSVRVMPGRAEHVMKVCVTIALWSIGQT